MRRWVLSSLGAAAIAAAAPSANAATVFYTDFDSIPVALGNFIILNSAEGWTRISGGGIELQDNVAGLPSTGLPNDNFVELDSTSNTVMGRMIDAGSYHLSFLYSPRPNVAQASNGIQIALNGSPLLTVSQPGGPQTDWQPFALDFVAGAASTLSFAAIGTSDSLGGYIDNIRLETAVIPEPAAWAMMLLGFGGVGAVLRSRRRGAFA